MDDTAKGLLDSGEHRIYGDYLQERSHPLGALISEKGLKEGRPEIVFKDPSGYHFWASPFRIGRKLSYEGQRGQDFMGTEALNLHFAPTRIKQWEAPEHGIQRAGFVYHPEDKTGHIIINDEYHIPVTREELIALGRKRYKKLKLAREHIKPLIEQGQYAIAADALEEYGHPLASLLRKEGVSKITPKIGDIRDSDGLYPFTSGFQAQKLGSAPAKWMGVVHDTLDAYVRPRRVKRWVNPDIGIRDAGVLYHPTRKSGYVVIDTGKDQPQTWIPVTHEELKNLGHKKLKLAREHIKPLIEQGQYQIAGDELQDAGHTELGKLLSQVTDSHRVKSLPRYDRVSMYERRKDLEAPDLGIHHVAVGPHGVRINKETHLSLPETEGQRLSAEYTKARAYAGNGSWKPKLDEWFKFLREQGHPLGKVPMEDITKDEIWDAHRGNTRVWSPGARLPSHVRQSGASAARRIRSLEAPELGIHRVGKQGDTLFIVGHGDIRDRYPAVTKIRLPAKLKLSRPLTDLLSKTQKVKRLLATRIAKEAGLKLSGLLDARSRDTADVIQIYDHDKDHEGVNYAAAWYGMVSKAPRVRVFHTAPDGPDILYQWRTEQDPEDALAQAPEGALATSDGRMTYLDHGGQGAPIPGAKAERGHAVTMNGRDAFRERIRSYES